MNRFVISMKFVQERCENTVENFIWYCTEKWEKLYVVTTFKISHCPDYGFYRPKEHTLKRKV